MGDDQVRPSEEVPVAEWELARHGKSKQPTRLARRLRHLQYVLFFHRRYARRLTNLFRFMAEHGVTPPKRGHGTPLWTVLAFPFGREAYIMAAGCTQRAAESLADHLSETVERSGSSQATLYGAFPDGEVVKRQEPLPQWVRALGPPPPLVEFSPDDITGTDDDTQETDRD